MRICSAMAAFGPNSTTRQWAQSVATRASAPAKRCHGSELGATAQTGEVQASDIGAKDPGRVPRLSMSPFYPEVFSSQTYTAKVSALLCKVMLAIAKHKFNNAVHPLTSSLKSKVHRRR